MENLSKEKQIEEMIDVIRKNTESCKTCDWLKEGLCMENCELEEDNQKICEDLYNAGYRKQSEPFSCAHEKGSEWISVDDRFPEDVYGKDRKIITVLVCTKSGRVSTASRVRMMRFNKEKLDYEYTDIFEWSGYMAKKVTHWMPLPEAPKMKGGVKE